MKEFFKDRRVVLLTCLFTFFTAWWLYLAFTQTNPLSLPVVVFTSSYGVITLLGGFWGYKIATRWGGRNSHIGRVVTYLTLGLLGEEVGQIFFTVTYFSNHFTVPYPSLADVGFVSSAAFYILALINLKRGLSIKFSKYSLRSRLALMIVIPFGALMLYSLVDSGYLFAGPDFTASVFFDTLYLVSYISYLMMAIVIAIFAIKSLGGVMRGRILLVLFSILLQFAADYNYMYESSRGVVLLPSVNDLLYVAAFFGVGLAILSCDPGTVDGL